MTSERKRSIIILGITMLLGIFIGLLVPGFVHKVDARRNHTAQGPNDHDRDSEHRRKWFVGTVNRIIQPDSAQAHQIKPIAEWASLQIDSIENSANHQMSVLLDSVRSRLQPIVTDEQMKRLEEFDNRAKSSWRGRGHPEKR